MLAGMEAGLLQSLRRLDDVVTGAVDRSIVLSRMLQAPREQVFELWTSPEHLANWWGPNGFTLTTHEADIRPGGVWRFTMHGPDGVDYPNVLRYDEDVHAPSSSRSSTGTRTRKTRRSEVSSRSTTSRG